MFRHTVITLLTHWHIGITSTRCFDTQASHYVFLTHWHIGITCRNVTSHRHVQSTHGHWHHVETQTSRRHINRHTDITDDVDTLNQHTDITSTHRHHITLFRHIDITSTRCRHVLSTRRRHNDTLNRQTDLMSTQSHHITFFRHIGITSTLFFDTQTSHQVFSTHRHKNISHIPRPPLHQIMTKRISLSLSLPDHARR